MSATRGAAAEAPDPAPLLVTAREMRAIDARAIQGLGIPSLELMEAAGRAVTAAAEDVLRGARDRAVVVLCGRGNNGGDGLVAARLLAARGARVHAFLVGEGGRLSADAAANLERAREAGIVPVALASRPPHGGHGEGDELGGRLREADLVIDALFGTGLTRAIDGVAAHVIERVNAAARERGLPVLAIDVPSGVDGDTGAAEGPVIRARRTVSLGCPKLGLYLHPARAYAGRITVADIGIPDTAAADVAREENITRRLFDETAARALLPPRRPDAHKGDHGHVLIVAGAPGFTGAAALASLGALRAGAGLVTLAIPRGLNAVMEVKLTEAMTLPVTESAAGTHTTRALEELLAAADGKRGVAVGPGFSRHPEAAALARELVLRLPAPVVLDADGLNAFGDGIDALAARKVHLGARAGAAEPPHAGALILTPHPGEMARLLGTSTREVVADRFGAARDAARRAHAVVVLKGAPTVIADIDGRTWINPTGNPGLATGGTGDVLTGVILGLVSQGVDPAGAARLGVFLHGSAADLLSRRMGPAGYLAGEVAAAIPGAIKRIGRDPWGRARRPSRVRGSSLPS